MCSEAQRAFGAHDGLRFAAPPYKTTDNSNSLTEAELFYNYLGQRISQDGREAPVADLFVDFQAYCRELDEVSEKLREAEESSNRGESKPLNLTALLERVEQRWDTKGLAPINASGPLDAPS